MQLLGECYNITTVKATTMTAYLNNFTVTTIAISYSTDPSIYNNRIVNLPRVWLTWAEGRG